jgi:DNA polymerase III delta prime subunit
MLWCTNPYKKSFETILHHRTLINNLKNTTLLNLQHTIFYGKSGGGKKTIAKQYIDYLLMKHYNIKKVQLRLDTHVIHCKAQSKEGDFEILKNNHYYVIDMEKLGKRLTLFFNVFFDNIIQTVNIHSKFPNIFLIENLYFPNYQLVQKFNNYLEKFPDKCRFICICNKISDLRKLKTYYFSIRIPFIKQDILRQILTEILQIHFPKKKLTTAKFNKIFQHSRGALAKSIFYLQIEYCYGATVFKQLINKDLIIYKKIFQYVTSKKLSNLEKIRELVYSCLISDFQDNSFMRGFFNYLITHETDFFREYNSFILELLKLFLIAHSNTNKTVFISIEAFIMKLFCEYIKRNS